jgi:hypothetical protein
MIIYGLAPIFIQECDLMDATGRIFSPVFISTTKETG